MIRRTRGVCLVSEGTLYERADDALEEFIGSEERRRSALSAVTVSHSCTVVKLCSKSVDFLLVLV